MEKRDRVRILFLCTGNSCRSQMAEGWARQLRRDEIEAYSAGVSPKAVDPRAIEAMAEVGLDISKQKSKSLADLRAMPFDYVVTLCDNAHQSCPAFPGTIQVRHVGFEDPPYLARTARNDEEAMAHYRRIRDEIRAFIERLPESLMNEDTRGPSIHQRQFEIGIKGFWSQFPRELRGKKGEEGRRKQWYASPFVPKSSSHEELTEAICTAVGCAKGN
jgi:arsenate reductase